MRLFICLFLRSFTRSFSLVRSFIAEFVHRRGKFSTTQKLNFGNASSNRCDRFRPKSSKSELSSRFFSRSKFCCSEKNWHKTRKKSTCHFLVNSADRPRIWTNRNQMRPNPGTIGRIRQKMAYKVFELQTAQKSRG